MVSGNLKIYLVATEETKHYMSENKRIFVLNLNCYYFPIVWIFEHSRHQKLVKQLNQVDGVVHCSLIQNDLMTCDTSSWSMTSKQMLSPSWDSNPGIAELDPDGFNPSMSHGQQPYPQQVPQHQQQHPNFPKSPYSQNMVTNAGHNQLKYVEHARNIYQLVHSRDKKFLLNLNQLKEG